MKKSLIAGAASLAIAALPVVSSFAVTPVTDTINVTVEDGACTFNRTAGEGTYNTSILPGTFAENFGSSTFTAICNDDDYPQTVNVTADFTALTNGTVADDITYSTNAVSGEASTWRVTAGSPSGVATALANGGALINEEISEAKTATVWYSVGAKSDQNPGTYTGYATYTLAEN